MKKFDCKIWRDYIFGLVVIACLLPILMDLFIRGIDLPWYVYIGVVAFMSFLFSFRVKEYNIIQISDKEIVARNLFCRKYDVAIPFDDILFVEYGIPMGRGSEPNLAVFLISGEMSTIFLRLMRYRDNREFVSLIIQKCLIANREDIDLFLSHRRKQVNKSSGGVHISKLSDYSSLKIFCSKISPTTKLTLVAGIVFTVCMFIAALYFNELYIYSIVCLIVFSLCGYGVHAQEGYVAISDTRLFVVSRFSNKTVSTHYLEDVERIYFTRWIDGVQRIILYNNSKATSISFVALNNDEIEQLSSLLRKRGINTYHIK